MKDWKKLRERFMRDPLPVRLGGLAATLARISSCARNSDDSAIVAQHLDEAKHLIEWTAADAEPEIAAELMQIQRLIALWQKAWHTAHKDIHQRALLSTQAKDWSNKTVAFSGLL